MLWLGLFVGTVGVVMVVPTILRARDGMPLDSVNGSIAFGATTFGIVGVAASQVGGRFPLQFILALAVGGVFAAFHREILIAMRPAGAMTGVDPHASVILDDAAPPAQHASSSTDIAGTGPTGGPSRQVATVGATREASTSGTTGTSGTGDGASQAVTDITVTEDGDADAGGTNHDMTAPN